MANCFVHVDSSSKGTRNISNGHGFECFIFLIIIKSASNDFQKRNVHLSKSDETATCSVQTKVSHKEHLKHRCI